MLFSRWAPVALTFALVACGTSAASSDEQDGGPEGKADGVTDGEWCPADVALNAGEGSAKRCYDGETGRFVPTECCADLCEGASMRTQSNGDRCAWTGEPGLPGATTGQFAPQICCDLNADLACGRASLEGGRCLDGEAEVDAVCCEQEPTACHPSIASAIDACVYEQIEGLREEGQPLPTEMALFETCVEELELLAPRIDARCAFQPELPFCGLTFEAIALDYVAPCAVSERADHDCTFGATYFDLADQAHIAVVDRAEHTLASAEGSEVQAQIIEAVSGVYEETFDLPSAFDAVDDGRINVVEVFDLSRSVGYTAIEFGAGDNSYGAIFRSGTLERAADITDGDIGHCEAPLGEGGNLCQSNDDCADGFRCEGTTDAPNPISTPLGLCVDTGIDASFEDCDTLRGCEGGYCAGLVAFDGNGMCSPGWMFGERRSEQTVAVDGDVARDDVLIYGQATVPVDLTVTLDLFHDVDTAELTVELLIPGYDGAPDADRPRVTVWPAEGITTAHPTGGRVTLPVRAFGDESINGAWTLVVTDTAADGSEGGVFGWTLGFSSRYD